MKYKEKFEAFKVLINKLKAAPCADCGEHFPPCAMDFDHRDREKKRFNVGTGYSYSLPVLMEEIDKCDIICANCHRVRTFGNGRGADE